MPTLSLEASRLALELGLGAGRNAFNTGRYVFLVQDDGVSRKPLEHEFWFKFDSSTGKSYYTTYALCEHSDGDDLVWQAIADGVISRETIDCQTTQANFLVYLQTNLPELASRHSKDSITKEHLIIDEEDSIKEDLMAAMDYHNVDDDEEAKAQLKNDLADAMEQTKNQTKNQMKKKNEKNRVKHKSGSHQNDNREVDTGSLQSHSAHSESALTESVLNEQNSNVRQVARLQELETTMAVLQGEVGVSFEVLNQVINASLWQSNRSAEDFPRYLLALLWLAQDEGNRILSDAQKTYAQAFAEHAILTFDAPFTKRGKSQDMGSLQSRCLAFAEEFSTCQWVRLYSLATANPPAIHVSDETKDHILKKLLVLRGTNFYPFITNTTSMGDVLLNGAALFDAKAIPITRSYGDSEAKTGLLDTENHIILREGSRYIANFFRGIDQTDTDLQRGLCEYLTHILDHGMTEFNSIPYAGYAVEGLLNLFECLPEQDPIAMLAGQILDNLFLAHALNTTPDGRGHKPFARRKGQEHKSLHYIGPDDTQALYASLCDNDRAFSFYYGHSSDDRKNGGAKFAVTALTCTRYKARLAALLSELPLEETSYAMTQQNDVPYFSHRCPKYQYLLTGGGAQFSSGKQVVASSNKSSLGTLSLLVTDTLGLNRLKKTVIQENGTFIANKTTEECIARNITLLLPGAEQLSDSFHFSKKENTNPCLFYDLAVGSSHVTIPDLAAVSNVRLERTKVASDRTVGEGTWSFYSVSTHEEGRFLYVLVFNGRVNDKDLGVMMVISSETPLDEPQDVLDEVTGKNPLGRLAKGVVWYPKLGESPIKNTAIQYDNYLEVPRYYPVVSVFPEPDPWKLDRLPERADCCIPERQYSNAPAWTTVATHSPVALNSAATSALFEPVQALKRFDDDARSLLSAGTW